MTPIALRIPDLLAAYRDGAYTPTRLIAELVARAAQFTAHNVWISAPDAADLARRAAALEATGMDDKPLWGVPFVVKDNLDVAGLPTTAGCAAYSRVATTTAPAVQALLDAGAILVGKANMDQFASGLNGTRSDFGVCRNAFNPDFVAGGSSSGSAVAVALGLASFALGTDTAGSGRVPAAFNNVVGVKPTRGLISTRGLLPACRTLDCVSIFALDCRDAAQLLDLLAAYDPEDPYARPYPVSSQRGNMPAANPAAAPRPETYRPDTPLAGFGIAGTRIGVPLPGQLEADCDADTLAAFARASAALKAAGAQCVPVDISPLLATARLLYDAPRVAERYAAIREFFDAHAGAVHPVVAAIVARGRDARAHEVWDAEHQLADLRQRAATALADCDALLLPTTPTHPLIADVLAEPVAANTRLGRYTNFVNLLDLAGVAVPAGRRANGLPVGVTLLGRAFSDRYLLALAAELHPALNIHSGVDLAPVPAYTRATAPPPGSRAIVLVGAHMHGLPLNIEMTARGARFLRHTRTAPDYRMYLLEGRVARPGLVAVANGGVAIATEVWAMPDARFGDFLASIPAPLGLGHVRLDDGSREIGFICEATGADGATDLSEFGGWRAWLATQNPPPPDLPLHTSDQAEPTAISSSAMPSSAMPNSAVSNSPVSNSPAAPHTPTETAP